ncbi:MAG: PucR family transcriptional regulator [Sulfobacillus sp.]
MILVHQLIEQAVPGAVLYTGRRNVDRPVRRIMAIEGTLEGLRNVVRHDLIVVVPGSWRIPPLEFIKSAPSTGASGILLWEALTTVDESDCEIWQAPAGTTFSFVLQTLIELLLAHRMGEASLVSDLAQKCSAWLCDRRTLDTSILLSASELLQNSVAIRAQDGRVIAGIDALAQQPYENPGWNPNNLIPTPIDSLTLLLPGTPDTSGEYVRAIHANGGTIGWICVGSKRPMPTNVSSILDILSLVAGNLLLAERVERADVEKVATSALSDYLRGVRSIGNVGNKLIGIDLSRVNTVCVLQPSTERWYASLEQQVIDLIRQSLQITVVASMGGQLAWLLYATFRGDKSVPEKLQRLAQHIATVFPKLRFSIGFSRLTNDDPSWAAAGYREALQAIQLGRHTSSSEGIFDFRHYEALAAAQSLVPTRRMNKLLHEMDEQSALFLSALIEYQGNITKVSQTLAMNRNTAYRRIEELSVRYGLDFFSHHDRLLLTLAMLIRQTTP